MSETAAAPVQGTAAPTKPVSTQPKKELTRQQKAAAVIISLGTEKASQLYQYMDPEEVEQITLEVARMGFLDSAIISTSFSTSSRSASGIFRLLV